jgi:hypothetical protein
LAKTFGIENTWPKCRNDARTAAISGKRLRARIDTFSMSSESFRAVRRASMLRSATLVLAILIALGSFGLSASAFASDGGYRAVGAGVGVRGDNFGVALGGTPGDGHDDTGNHTSGLGELRGCRGRDIWGHWGAYYGPMIPMI